LRAFFWPDLFPRFIEASIREALTDTRVVAIAGPRQSGKSTLARSIAGRSATYLSLDEAVNLKADADDPTGFVRRARGLTVIDEIQRVPELMLAIKLAVDEDPTPGRFLITGLADIRTLLSFRTWSGSAFASRSACKTSRRCSLTAASM
jgi:predicted AAA+ superfamily ATPase